MKWVGLYLRSRNVPAALAMAACGAVLMWSMWSLASDTREAGMQMVVLTILLLVAALTVTLGGPDDALEATAAFSWPRRRIVHLLTAFLIVAGLLLVTLATGAQFGPAGLVVRDAAGLLGLTALGAAALGTARAWFVPLGWTMAAVLYPRPEPVLGQVLTWQAQDAASRAAAVTAGVLAVGGLIAYAVVGPAPKAPAEAAQQ